MEILTTDPDLRDELIKIAKNYPDQVEYYEDDNNDGTDLFKLAIENLPEILSALTGLIAIIKTRPEKASKIKIEKDGIEIENKDAIIKELEGDK